MATQTTLCSTLKGHSFAIEDHVMIKDWAIKHHYNAVVTLDHGAETEEYEEVVTFFFGSRCLFVIWRNLEAVFMQPIVGRSQQYGSVQEALDACRPPTARRSSAIRAREPVGSKNLCLHNRQT